jgi:hypothetical protein
VKPLSVKHLAQKTSEAQCGEQKFAMLAAQASRIKVLKHNLAKEVKTHKAVHIKQAKKQVSEALQYLVFLACVSVTVLLSRVDADIFYFMDHVSEQLQGVEFNYEDAHIKKTFRDVATVTELHQWMRGPLYKALWTASTFDGVEFNSIPPMVGGTLQNKPGYILGQSRLMGGVRIGQVRVNPMACQTPSAIKFPSAPTCYPQFSRQCESRAPFGTNGATYEATAWADADEEPEYYSPITRAYYTQPRFSVTMPGREEGGATGEGGGEVLAAIERLAETGFVDLQTSALFFDVNVYNPNLDFFCIIRLVAELLPSGGVITHAKMDTVRLVGVDDFSQGAGALSILHTASYGIMMLFVLYFVWVELAHLGLVGGGGGGKRSGRGRRAKEEQTTLFAYLTKGENLLHVVNLVLFLIVFGMDIDGRVKVEAQRSRLVADDYSLYIPLRSAADALTEAQDLSAFNAFLSWIKTFYYLAFVPKLRILIGTLSHASGNITGFMVVFLIVLWSSTMTFMLIFHTHLLEFRSLTDSFFMLLRMLMGQFDFDGMLRANRIFAPLLFSIFILVVLFVLLSMFIAIISDAYNTTKLEIEIEEATGDKPRHMEAAIVLLWEDGLCRVPVLGAMMKRGAQHAKRLVGARGLAHRGLAPCWTVLDMVFGTKALFAKGLIGSMDQDGDGLITVDEAVLVLVSTEFGGGGTSVAVTEEEVRSLLEAVDSDGSGEFSMDEMDELTKSVEALIARKTTQAARSPKKGGRLRSGGKNDRGDGIIDVYDDQIEAQEQVLQDLRVQNKQLQLLAASQGADAAAVAAAGPRMSAAAKVDGSASAPMPKRAPSFRSEPRSAKPESPSREVLPFSPLQSPTATAVKPVSTTAGPVTHI